MEHEAGKAIIMAAGMGRRMMPLTQTVPKPLLKVNGIRMIDTVIEALYKNGIDEVYIVIGYLKEKFYVLKEKYPKLHLIENPYYDKCNNISSLYVARKYLGECVILDGDQIIFQPEILMRKFEKSCYCCRWTEQETKEWVLEVYEGRVISCCRTGGKRGWQLYGISFWTQEDGERLRRHLEQEFEIKKNYHSYWDDVALFCYPEEYDLGIRKIREGDLIEIDNLSELKIVDSSYKEIEFL